MKVIVQSVHCLTTSLAGNNGPHDAYPNFDTFADDIPIELVYTLEYDGTQSYYLSDLMNKEDIFPPPLHFQKTSTNLQVESDLPIYPSVPKDWNHGPTNPIHIADNDWQEVGGFSYVSVEQRAKIGEQKI